MNGKLNGLDGMYGLMQFGALAELGRQSGTGKRTGSSWKRVALMLAAIAVPVALLLAGGFGS